MTAVPPPPPLQIEAIPYLRFKSFSAWIKVTMIRAPEVEKGWPKATAPPLILSFS